MLHADTHEKPSEPSPSVSVLEPPAAGDVNAAVLSELRTSWLADFEAVASMPPPPRPSWPARVRQAVRDTAAGVREIRELRRCERKAREAAAAVVEREVPELVEPQPVAPAGPVAPPVQEAVVLNLRDAWVADVAAQPERHAPKPVPWHRKLYEGFEPAVEEVAFWADCLAALAHRQMMPKEQRRKLVHGERAKRANAAAQTLTAIFVIAFAVGIVLYVSMVVHILDPKQLARVLHQ